MDGKELKSYCQGEECEHGVALCCKDCPIRSGCEDVCGGPEDGAGVDGPCEYRV